MFAATGVALAWAALDERHQTWVAGRHGSPVDWTIDAAGVGIAVALTLRWATARRGRDGVPATTPRVEVAPVAR